MGRRVWPRRDGRVLRHTRAGAANPGDNARQPFDVVLAYSSAMAPCLAAAEGARRICDLVDVDSAKWGSYAKSERGLGRWLFSREQRAVARTEQAACENADAVVVVTQAEAELLRKIRPAKADDNVHVIGNGVDCDYFDLSAVRPYSDGQATGDVLVFVGTMDYRPNVEAVCWFVQNVWLAIRRQRPGAVFRIVGRDPVGDVRKLAAVEGVHVTGTVADVRGHLAEASAAVFPLQMSPGVPNKLLEAMAAGRAVIASPCAAAGLDVQAPAHLLLADLPAQWQQQVLAVLADNELRLRLGEAARRRAVERFSWESQLAPLVDLCNGDSEERRAKSEGRNSNSNSNSNGNSNNKGTSEDTAGTAVTHTGKMAVPRRGADAC